MCCMRSHCKYHHIGQLSWLVEHSLPVIATCSVWFAVVANSEVVDMLNMRATQTLDSSDKSLQQVVSKEM